SAHRIFRSFSSDATRVFQRLLLPAERYVAAPVGCRKMFSLLCAVDDWSLHLFEEDRVAFFGLTSCSRNDEFWTGASFTRAAIVKVGQEARKLLVRLGSDALLAAVWHHGLEREKGRPDRR